MNFKEQLNYYTDNMLKCTSKELSEYSKLSPAVISRYRTGEKEPTNNHQLSNLADGLSKLAIKYKVANMDKDVILMELSKNLNLSNTDFEKFQKNLNEIISILNINIAEMSRVLNFDPSYISRIRSGKRKPSNIENFIDSICNFIVRKYSSKTDKLAIANLIHCTYDELSTNSDYLSKLSNWLCFDNIETPSSISDFLLKLDTFNLDDYIRLIHFDDLKVPSVPFTLPTNKTYYGIKEMQQGELDFFKATVLSKSKTPLFMCSDMPIEDMAKDVDFAKKWMFAIAMTLKKGLHLNIIHNIDRPFNEMMLGLESWIPIYMTGQVSPYYLKGTQNSIYCHLNYFSGGVALTGECLKNSNNNGKYFLTNNKEELAYYKEKTENLLKLANPLMNIYKKDSENVYNAFIIAESKTIGNRHNILSSPPLFTISDTLLKKILIRNNIKEEDSIKILNFKKNQKILMQDILNNNNVLDEYPKLSKEEFCKHPVLLSLSPLFYENAITYTYEEYLEHINLTKTFAKSNSNYTVEINNNLAFRNIQIFILENNWVMISKNTNPTIHFVIKHAKLRNAIENFIAPITQ